MNNSATRLLAGIADAHKYAQDKVDSGKRVLPLVTPLLDSLSSDCTLNPYGGAYWFTTKNRDDIAVLMRLAPLWSKSSRQDHIQYSATVDGTKFWITAQDGALPPTCKLVQREIVVPAQPERKTTILVVECDNEESTT